jgi:enoyl-CoA hydratase/carnithine racemase
MTTTTPSAATNPPFLLCETQAFAAGGSLAILRLNRASSLNALDLPMVTALLAQVQAWRDDPEIRALWIESTLEKAFCAGGDVRAMRDSALARSAADQPCVDAEAFFAAEYRLDYTLHRFGKPVIAWGHGIVMGGGLGIFAAASHRIVTATTRIAMPEITIALFPDVGAGYFLPRMPGRLGLFCALTAAQLNASDALAVGLATQRLAHSQKADVLWALSHLALKGDGRDTQKIAALLNLFAAKNPEPLPDSPLQNYRTVIDHCCDLDDLSLIIERILQHSIDDPWWQACQANLRAGSPLTARVIQRQLQQSAALSLLEVFQLDYVLASNIVRHPEFSEGVRALLVDKDRQPRWQYPTVNEVPDSLIDTLFTPPWSQNPLADLAEL